MKIDIAYFHFNVKNQKYMVLPFLYCINEVKTFYWNANAWLKVKEVSESFRICEHERQGCVLLSWLFTLSMDVAIKEIR